MPKTLPGLNKTEFALGYRCSKAIWLAAHRPEVFSPPDPEAQARMDVGRRVGRVAQLAFPAGVMAPALEAGSSAPSDLSEAPAVFEVPLEANGLRARVDILARGQHGWRLIEVKSSSKAKPEHIPDAAFQLFVARAAGLEIESVEILHLNPEYVRRGDLDPQGLFASTRITEEAEDLLAAVPILAAEMRSGLARQSPPEVPIGPHCLVPRECGALDHCWSGVPEESVLGISNLTWEKKFGLYDRGIRLMTEVGDEVPLPDRSRRHVRAVRAGRPILERDELLGFLEGLTLPVYLLDFETVAPALPVWDGTRPYQKIPFQYSLHVMRDWESAPESSGFLAQPGPDPRPALLASLLPATEGTGTILAYHMPFELGVMKDLAAAFPDRRAEIESRLPRMDDLIRPFKAWHFWLPEMGGSFSIKSVAPAVAPELTYDDLDIRNGLAASTGYERLLAGVDPEEERALRRRLLDYCERDTLAMVRVLQAIRRAAFG